MWVGSKKLGRSAWRCTSGVRQASAKAGAPVTLRIPQGSLRGKTQLTPAGRVFRSFLRIPYAKPPVGKLRFQPPEPPESWNGVRDATTFGEVAPQINLLTGSCRGNEDCLFLNVYTSTTEENSGDLKPVMVWLHGGGYIMGSGNADFYGPEYLLEHEVVLVTLNYRLGVLGFLSTGDSVVPGNMGLKDQVMALQWVKDNIALFGGNPDNVTVFGGSAGGMSSEYLMLSPKGKGLLHRAVSQSGVAIADTVCNADVPERTFRLAKYLGLSTNKSAELLDYMMKVPAKTLTEKQYKGFSEKDKARILYFPFLPTVEDSVPEGDAFIKRHPLEILKSNDYLPVPYLLGINEKEGLIYLKDILAKTEVLSFLDKNFKYLVPTDIDDKIKDVTPISEAIRTFYFKNERVSESTLDILLNLLGDKQFNYPVVRAATLHSVQKSCPVHLYHFSADTGLNYARKLFGIPDKRGACHSDETAYLFKNNAMPTEVKPHSAEETAIARMTKLWTNFAKTGNPTPEDDPLLTAKWPLFNANNPEYLNISHTGLEVGSNLLQERMSFWEDLYNKLNL
ncbi:juvenile hormone esterase-like [Schistocerca serialis cubense]|uniref:juvenile hormone esterase-like n=1 Tax=Schistocerca serialis cubense TaxID=2023355 RepID=UPI00214E4358|nr:juvenile hormone esterase-like [Schistocerca serialis cubense]